MGWWTPVMTVVMAASVFCPQPGYIHPDEFFQSVEVVAGDFFNVTHYRSWEFNPEKPVRDITLPYILLLPAFEVLHLLMPVLDELGVSKSSLLITLPRVVLACANVINFAFVQKLCQEFNCDDKQAMWLLSSSYVLWVYLTHTFSNTIETLLFSFVCLILLDLHQNFSKPRDSSQGKKNVARHHTKHFVSLGVLTCLGIFNRPTFPVFLLVPFIWFIGCLSKTACKNWLCCKLVCVSGTSFLLTGVMLCIVNSCYYSTEFILKTVHSAIAVFLRQPTSLSHIMESLHGSLKVPPYNFLVYNLNSSNLAGHGIHSRVTHLLVNLPLLLGPMAVVVYWDFAHLLITRGCHRISWVSVGVMVPVICLSFFTHQEPRFLLPVLPLAVVSAAGSRVVPTKVFRCCFVMFNVLGFLFYGFLHQAGLISALSAVQQELAFKPQTSSNPPQTYHFVFFCTYMPPRHLLLADRQTAGLVVHDLGGLPAGQLKIKMNEVNSMCETGTRHCHIKLFFPGSVERDVRNVVSWQNMHKSQFCPHLSTEQLPQVGAYLNGDISVTDLMSQFCLKVYSWTSREIRF